MMVSKDKLLFNFDARDGSLRDKVSGTVPTNTGLDVVKTEKGRALRKKATQSSSIKLDYGKKLGDLFSDNFSFSINIDWKGGRQGAYAPIVRIENYFTFGGINSILYLAIGGVFSGTLLSTSISSGWHNIIINVDLSQNIANIYIDGSFFDDFDITGYITNTPSDLSIFDSQINYLGECRISTVNFYRGLLSATERQDLYNEFLHSGNISMPTVVRPKVEHKSVEQEVQYGDDINSNFNFTSGWTPTADASVIDSNSFSVTTNNRGLSKALLINGKRYYYKISGTKEATVTAFGLRNLGTFDYYSTDFTSDTFSEEGYFTSLSASLFLCAYGSGQINIDTLIIYPVDELVLFHNYENGNAIDLTNNGNDGTPVGVDFGKDGANLNGGANTIELASTITTAKTCVALINIKENTGSPHNLFGSSTSANYIRVKSDLTAINIEGSSSSVTTLDYDFKTGIDYFIETVLVGTTWTLRVNGEEIESQDVGGTANVEINYIAGVSSFGLSGSIKYAKIYNYARTLAQHKADYNKYAKQLLFQPLVNLDADGKVYGVGEYVTNDVNVESGSVKVVEQPKAEQGDILLGWDLTSGWNIAGAVVVNDLNTFTTTSSGGLHKVELTVGKAYTVKLNGNTTATNIGIRNSAGQEASGFISDDFGTYTFIAESTSIYIRNEGAGITNITAFEINEIQAIPEGTKRIVQETEGITSMPCNIAYATWEFGLLKGDAGNNTYVRLISDKKDGSIPGRVVFAINSNEGLALYNDAGTGADQLFRTDDSYVLNNTFYDFRITRTLDGEFTVYIKSDTDSNFSNWTLVDPTGGSGTNPVTNNTYTTTKWFVTEMDAGDRIKDIKIFRGVQQ